jgi:hypothetical protein
MLEKYAAIEEEQEFTLRTEVEISSETLVNPSYYTL